MIGFLIQGATPVIKGSTLFEKGGNCTDPAQITEVRGPRLLVVVQNARCSSLLPEQHVSNRARHYCSVPLLISNSTCLRRLCGSIPKRQKDMEGKTAIIEVIERYHAGIHKRCLITTKKPINPLEISRSSRQAADLKRGGT